MDILQMCAEIVGGKNNICTDYVVNTRTESSPCICILFTITEELNKAGNDIS